MAGPAVDLEDAIWNMIDDYYSKWKSVEVKDIFPELKQEMFNQEEWFNEMEFERLKEDDVKELIIAYYESLEESKDPLKYRGLSINDFM